MRPWWVSKARVVVNLAVGIGLHFITAAKLSSAVSDAYYFGHHSYAAFEAIQCIVLVAVGVALLCNAEKAEASLPGGLLFGLFTVVAGIKAGVGYADCGCIPGTHFTPGRILIYDAAISVVFMMVACPDVFRSLGGVCHRAGQLLLGRPGRVALMYGSVTVYVLITTVGMNARTGVTPSLVLPNAPVPMVVIEAVPDSRHAWFRVNVPFHNRGDSDIQLLGIPRRCGVYSETGMPLQIGPNSSTEVAVLVKAGSDVREAVVNLPFFTDDVPGLRGRRSFVARR
jgi:hypothetical protein